jgi:hypothetical protein
MMSNSARRKRRRHLVLGDLRPDTVTDVLAAVLDRFDPTDVDRTDE